MKDEAKLRVALTEHAHMAAAYKTLFYGLKKNHPHNMAIVHPLAFLVRRVIYAFVIINFLKEVAMFGALILLATCLVMMAFVMAEAQWEDKMINGQHLANEAFFYLLCISLVLFSGVTTNVGQKQSLSSVMIGAICAMIAVNVFVILYYSVAHIR